MQLGPAQSPQRTPAGAVCAPAASDSLPSSATGHSRQVSSARRSRSVDYGDICTPRFLYGGAPAL